MHIDLPAISAQFGVSELDIARAMYPDNKLPYQAFTRMVEDRDGDFKLGQVAALAETLGCTPRDLFPVEGGYYATFSEGKNTFRKGDVRVTVDMASGTATVFVPDCKASVQYLTSPTLTLPDFLAQVTLHADRIRDEAERAADEK